MTTKVAKYRGRGDLRPPETAAERRFVTEARKLGCKTRKLNGGGQRDWPDQLVVVQGGGMLLIEFKREGEDLRPTQAAFHDDLRLMGLYIFTTDSWEAALAHVRAHIRRVL